MFHVFIYTDGSCLGNPGVGGYSAILMCGEESKEVVGLSLETTNNRMELMAIYGGLKAIKRPCEISVITDSAPAIGWCSGKWKINDRHIKAIVNRIQEQINRLKEMGCGDIWFEKVEGHSGHAFNQQADKLAKAQAFKAKELAANHQTTLSSYLFPE